MSLDASLKAANALIRHRNVLTRDERLAKLKEEEKWQDGGKIFGLPKVGHRKMAVGGKAAKEAEGEAAAGTPAAGVLHPPKVRLRPLPRRPRAARPRAPHPPRRPPLHRQQRRNNTAVRRNDEFRTTNDETASAVSSFVYATFFSDSDSTCDLPLNTFPAALKGLMRPASARSSIWRRR